MGVRGEDSCSCQLNRIDRIKERMLRIVDDTPGLGHLYSSSTDVGVRSVSVQVFCTAGRSGPSARNIPTTAAAAN